MDPQLLLFAGSTALVGGAIALARWRIRRTNEARAALAEKLGLTYVPPSLFRGAHLFGQLEGLAVSVRWTTQVVASGMTNATNDRTTYELRGLPPSLSMKRAGLATGLKRLVAGGAPGMDDESFDRAVELEGDELDRAVLLVEALRHRARGVIDLGARVESGRLTLVNEKKDTPDVAEDLLVTLTALAAALTSARANLPRVLTELVERGEHAARALDVLVTHFPTTPETIEACARTRNATDLRLRMLSAIGRDDFDMLRTIVAMPDASIAVRTSALEALLGSTDPRARLDASLEGALVALLASPSALAQRASADALGLCGTASAVEVLLDRTRGLLTDPAVKTRAQAAVKAIQGRVIGAGRGQLSLSGPEAHGALSLPGGGELTLSSTTGALSLDDRPREDEPNDSGST